MGGSIQSCSFRRLTPFCRGRFERIARQLLPPDERSQVSSSTCAVRRIPARAPMSPAAGR